MRDGWLSLVAAMPRHTFLLTSGIVLLLPFIWMLSLSLKPPQEAFGEAFSLLPQNWHAYENYRAALTSTPVPRFLLNGVIVCGGILIAQILIAAPAAYALAKLRFPGKTVVFGLVLVGLLLPQQVLALPLFIAFYYMGLLDTYAALILPFAVSPFAIFLFRQGFMTVPDDLVHAARLDGLGELSIVFRIALPSVLPVVIAFSIVSVISHWNDLFWPSIVIRSEHLMPPPLGIVFFRDADVGAAYGPLMAAATVVVAPLVIAFLVAQKRFIDGFVGVRLH
ncbi:MAG: carbohydrate ABC transporter permease [Alphaproteobacteria bacterium]|nr:carbohydrate ABC transporter permease [Alphaproteobacteria bacterium]